MSDSSFLAKDFQTQSGHSPKEHGGGVFSRVFAFLAALVLCLSVLTVFAQNVAAELTITDFRAERKDNSTITFSWTFSENVISYSYFFQEKGSTREVQGLSFSDETAGEKALDISIPGGIPGIQTNAEVRFRITALSFTPAVVESGWSNYVPTASNECYSQSTDDLKSDCLVLDALYDSTGGANWADRTNWKSANSLDTWHGVKTKDGRVYDIELYENQLTGTISSDIANLSGLTYLDLGNNSLSGTIPDLSALTKLKVLWLDGNSISGSIPDLSATELKNLRLNNNNIGGNIPSWLSNMDDMRELRLYNNRLSGTIPDLSNVGYYDLDLSNNNLSGTIPPATHFPEGMRDLLQGSNNRWGLPFAAGTLNLSNNSLSGAIPDMSSLEDLRYIDFSNNRLGGELSAAYFPAYMEELYLQNNQLSGSIPDMSSLTRLTFLELQNNRFSGTIPDLSSVSREVWLNGNSISGTIDADDFHTEVYFIYLHDNQLSGSNIDLSSLIQLKEISLWGNPNLDLMTLTGVESKAKEKAALVMVYFDTGGDGWSTNSGWLYRYNFGAWHGVTTDGSNNVTGLDLSDNNLRGDIGSGLPGLASLATLDLSDNAGLRGTFPVRLKNNTNITSVDIRCTGITVPTNDADFTTWKNGLGSSFQSGCAGGGGSQGSSPPPPPTESPDEKDGLGQGGGGAEGIQSPDPDPASPASPAIDPGNIEAAGGCALVSGAGGERPAAAALGLFLAASVLLAVSRVGRRENGHG